MRRLFVAVALLGSLCARAYAQGTTDYSGVRRALEVDPFAIAPYRLLTSGLSSTGRTALLADLGRGGRFADLVLMARLQSDGGQIAPARGTLQRAAQLLPDDSRALDAFCQLAMQNGAFAEAGAAAKKALERGRTPQRLVAAAITELRLGKRKEGLELLAEARKKDPVGSAADSALDVLLGQHMANEAAELLRAQLEPGGDGARGTGGAAQWRRLAELERQLGHTQQSSEAYLRALDTETSPTGRRAMAQSLMRLHREKKTLPELVRALKDAKTSARLVLRGDVEMELQHRPAALAAYEAAAKADPSDPDPPLRLATTAKTPAERADRYATLVAMHPGELRFALELADLRFTAKDDTAARKVLRDAAIRMATAPSAQEQIARRLGEHGDTEGALQCRRRAAELDPRNPDYALSLGDAYKAAGKKAEAIASYADSVARAGGSRAAWDRQIDALERAGYTEEANQRYEEARKKWPEDVVLARRFATVLERLHEWQRAQKLWEEISRKTARPFEREQADYNARRLDGYVREGRK
jgi:tetratricopeptide (TPR) repeat protein